MHISLSLVQRLRRRQVANICNHMAHVYIDDNMSQSRIMKSRKYIGQCIKQSDKIKDGLNIYTVE